MITYKSLPTTGGNVVRYTERVRKIIRAEGISSEELATMVENSAITSVRGFSRRYFHWLLKMENGVLINMQHADMIEVGKGSTRMAEPHEECEGEGCKACGWIGEIGRWIKDKPLPQHLPLGYKGEVYRREYTRQAN